MTLRFHAPYMEWAKTRPTPRFDLATSSILACSIDDLPGARDAIALTGSNNNGYAPLMQAIATRYGVSADQVTTAQGASGANFLVCAALLGIGHEVLVERPGYDPLLAAPHLLGAGTARFDRDFSSGFRLDPDRVRRAMTPATRLIIITSPHNPSGVIVDRAALIEIGQIAEAHDAHVLVDEVYLDATVVSMVKPDGEETEEARLEASTAGIAAAQLGAMFISTSSLTKSYGLAGLRCGWILSSPAVAERLRRARDVVDGTGPIVTERLATLAFENLDHLIARSKALLETNGSLVRDFLESRKDVEWADPQGGTVVFPRLRDVTDSRVFVERLLAQRGTAVVPGRFFEAPAHFRIGFGGPTEPLLGGLAEIGAALDARAW